MNDEERGSFFTSTELKTAETVFSEQAINARRPCADSSGRGTFFVDYDQGEVVPFPESDNTVTVDRLNVTYRPREGTVPQSPIEAIKIAILKLDDPAEMRRVYSVDDGKSPLIVPLQIIVADPTPGAQGRSVTIDYKMHPKLDNVFIPDRVSGFRNPTSDGEKPDFDIDNGLEMMQEHYAFLKYPVDLVATLISYLRLQRGGDPLTYDVIQASPLVPYDTMPPRQRKRS